MPYVDMLACNHGSLAGASNGVHLAFRTDDFSHMRGRYKKVVMSEPSVAAIA